MAELVGDGEPLGPSVDLVADRIIAAGTTTHCKDLHVLRQQDMLSPTLQTSISLLFLIVFTDLLLELCHHGQSPLTAFHLYFGLGPG